jgi:hypothetical protein
MAYNIKTIANMEKDIINQLELAQLGTSNPFTSPLGMARANKKENANIIVISFLESQPE